VLLLATAGLMTGCSAAYDKNFFDYDREQSRTRRVFEAQYAAGAQQEASLRAMHFDNVADATAAPVLNDLGRERLDYIAAARRPGEAILVTVDVDGVSDELVAAADRYVETLRLPDGAMRIESGRALHDTAAAGVLADVGAIDNSGSNSEAAGDENLAGLGGMFSGAAE
jgi:hypothetical protein